MDERAYWILAIAITVAIVALYMAERRRSKQGFVQAAAAAPIGPVTGLTLVDVPTSQATEFVLGHPSYEGVVPMTGQIIEEGDLALSPGFGTGPGTFGFGRVGNTFGA